MIDRIHFENFKSLADVTIELGPLTVLVGPNGSGKSSVLQGMHLLSQTGVPRPVENNQLLRRFATTFGGPLEPQRLTFAFRPSTIKLAMRERGGDELELTISVAEGTSTEIGTRCEFHVSVRGSDGPLETVLPIKSTGTSPMSVLDDPRVRRFASMVYLHLDANQMMQTSVSNEEAPRIANDGSDLASTLSWMKGAAEEDLARITADLARVVPGVTRIRTLRARITRPKFDVINVDGQPVWRPTQETVLGDRFEIDFDGQSVPADLLSEGTVLALGLLTKLHEPNRPRLVLLDDIDRGLHIGAQASLVHVLRELMKANADLQIVCTTHSPYLLDLFDPSEVRVLTLDKDRHTHAQPLTAHPDFEKWKFGTQTGELWAALGDAWAAGPSGS